MNAQEKTLIYNLLKTSDSYINGYSSASFKNEVSFEDDPKTQSQINVTPQEEKSGGMTIEQLNEKIKKCNRCGLCQTRTNIVPGEGVCNPLVLVVGEGPGYDEDMQGRPFVGKAGQLLDKMLAAIQLDRTKNCYIANVVKCRPPQNRDPSLEEQNSCYSFLEAQIKVLKPKMILCVGRISVHALLKNEESIGKIHGQFFDFNNIPLMATYHPSALLRNEDLKRPAWEDLKAFKQKLNELTQ